MSLRSAQVYEIEFQYFHTMTKAHGKRQRRKKMKIVQESESWKPATEATSWPHWNMIAVIGNFSVCLDTLHNVYKGIQNYRVSIGPTRYGSQSGKEDIWTILEGNIFYYHLMMMMQGGCGSGEVVELLEVVAQLKDLKKKQLFIQNRQHCQLPSFPVN